MVSDDNLKGYVKTMLRDNQPYFKSIEGIIQEL